MFIMGLDLGQAADFTALSIIDYRQEPRSFLVRHLQRFPLGTPYPEMVDRCIEIRQQLKGGALCIDATGVGRPVLDLFYEKGLTPVAITITGGDIARSRAEVEAAAKKSAGLFYTPSLRERMSWTVPKRDLVGSLLVAFQNHELKISSAIPDSKTLITEILNFRMKINTKTGHDSYEAWRDGQHDDLVLCVSLPVWFLMRAGARPGAKVSPGQMTGQNLPPAPTLTETPTDSWGNPRGFTLGDIPGL